MIVVMVTQLYTCVRINQVYTLNCRCIVYEFYLNKANLKAFSGQNSPLVGGKIYDEKEQERTFRGVLYLDGGLLYTI